MAKRTLLDAKNLVPSYVEPRDCFLEFANTATGYRPLPGTPCAHYVSHILNLKSGAGGYGCNKGYEVRVRALINQLTEINLDDVRINDVWARREGDKRSEGGTKEPTDHCGIVVSVNRSGPLVNIQIRHNSSGQRAVATNTWDHFGRGGKFYRPANASALPSSVLSNLYRARQQLPLRAG